MADIELLIKIPEDEYNIAKYGQYGNINVDIARKAIANGTPLPKGHGRLMILSEDKLEKNQINLDFSCQKWITEIGLSNATVAILGGEKNENKNI